MGTRIRPAVVIVALLVAVAACSTPEPNGGSSQPRSSNSQPGAASAGSRQDATLTGRIVAHDGTPLGGLPVTLLEGRSGAVVDAALTAVFTLGIACVASPGACDPGPGVAGSTTTDADGRFELPLPGAYLPGFETDEDWVVQVGAAPGEGELTGPSSSFELEVNTALQAAPDIVVWDSAPAITDAEGLLRVSVAPVTGGAELTSRSIRFIDDAGDVVWTVRGTTVDRRVIEDRSTRLVASGSADVVVRHAEGRTIYHQRVASPTVAYVGTSPPVSRGMSCTLADGGLVGCPFTDGDLTSEQPVSGAVTVDLGTPSEVGLVVVRGTGSARAGIDSTEAGSPVLVEGSVDGTDWQPLRHRLLDGAAGWSAGPAADAAIPSFRYIRVGRDASLAALAEVSVFGPTEAERAAARSDGSSGGADDNPALAVAAAAFVVAVGGAGVAVRRRQRR